MVDASFDEEFEIKVEFPPSPGRQQVALKPEDAARKASEALDKSMGTIHYMARRVASTMDSLGEHKPKEVEVAFGINLDMEAGALIAKAGIEASINVKLVWRPE